MIFERGHFDSDKSKSENYINEALRQTRLFSYRNASKDKPTVFLSHKHSDLKDLGGVMALLEGMGAQIYIDSRDNGMPKKTSSETALRIKEVIKTCSKFILLATDAAIESHWCNWELGIGDTHKYINHIALLPMKQKGATDNSYKGNEYLNIYPRIDIMDSLVHHDRLGDILFPKSIYVVRNPKGRDTIPLSEWLRN